MLLLVGVGVIGIGGGVEVLVFVDGACVVELVEVLGRGAGVLVLVEVGG